MQHLHTMGENEMVAVDDATRPADQLRVPVGQKPPNAGGQGPVLTIWIP
jgi:hypothetical protein